MKIKEIRDNRGETIDRYTVIYDIEEPGCPGLYWSVGMNTTPFHPRGFGQHCTAMPGRHLGKKITFKQLPPDCQKLVLQDLKEVAEHE